MVWLQELLESSNIPVITAFLLGLLTAISPCPLATNITAIGFISKQIGNSHRIFLNGILYTAGRIITYAGIGLILIPILREGASIYAIQKAIGRYGEMIIAPALILIGLFMLFGNRINIARLGFHRTRNESGKADKSSSNHYCETLKKRGGWGALFLGILFSLAFCPSSGIFFFGMLIPMSAAQTGGYLLPIVFAVATGLPVVVVAWILAYSIAGLGKFYNRIQTLQKYMNIIIATLFISIGIYYAIIL